MRSVYNVNQSKCSEVDPFLFTELYIQIEKKTETPFALPLFVVFFYLKILSQLPLALN